LLPDLGGGRGNPAVWTNKSFLSTYGVVLIRQYLTIAMLKDERKREGREREKETL
jgi:hypothetical protein